MPAISLRDFFAAHALQGLLAAGWFDRAKQKEEDGETVKWSELRQEVCMTARALAAEIIAMSDS